MKKNKTVEKARGGDPESKYQIGLLHFESALRLFNEAAAKGHEESKVMVVLLEHIISLGVGEEDVFIQ